MESLEGLLRKQKEISAQIENQLKLVSRFGNDEDYPEGTIFRFRHNFKRFGESGIAYLYAAIKADNGFWYLTCANTGRKTFAELINFIGDEDCWVIKINAGKKLKAGE